MKQFIYVLVFIEKQNDMTIFSTKSKPKQEPKQEHKPVERIFKTIAAENKGIENHYFGMAKKNNNIEEIKR